MLEYVLPKQKHKTKLCMCKKASEPYEGYSQRKQSNRAAMNNKRSKSVSVECAVSVFNPRPVGLSVCPFVCPSATALAAAASGNQLYPLFSLFEKTFRSKVMKKPICIGAHREPFSQTSETQELLEGRLVGRMLLQRLASGVKKSEIRIAKATACSVLAYAHAPNISVYSVPVPMI